MAKIDEERLGQIYLGDESARIAQVGALLRSHYPNIVEAFYNTLSHREEANLFLDSAMVEQRLKASLEKWLDSLFHTHDATSLTQLFATLIQVGQTHARINIPLHLVLEGVRIIRREISTLLSHSQVERLELVSLVVIANEVLDHAMSMINESYVAHSVANERNVQSLRLQMQPHLQALECERMKSVLLRWFGELWRARADEDHCRVSSLRRSEFGLWAFHKAPLLFANRDMVQRLLAQCETVDALLGSGHDGITDPKALSERRLEEVDKASKRLEVTLSLMREEALDMEMGRDPLTRVFNRRFLATVVNHEMGISLKHEIPFAFLLCDIDHFKSINDTHGHDAGDAVLRQFSERLLGRVRANDYIFRFGGEEFLILLGDMNKARLASLAEAFRKEVADAPFALPSGDQLVVTASFGGAVHGGHPDYNRCLKQADEALYEAKQSGRNRYVLAD
ncbi:GGDEF domain-containing protein [Magnetofaba australis]|uniref:Diguanylate cyclase DosC n=1 Tax=Magnetofaba australis IT-1 TaxID=1434232 RepID=A0A1Y2K6E8_9PROT|nr:GGDEF domain-containing protein [Magnetofaba australis]OSM04867.1 putative diguanylate cyclase [Magnetofaba australis IT-1]